MTESEVIEYVRRRFGNGPEVSFCDSGMGMEARVTFRAYAGINMRRGDELTRHELEAACDALQGKLKEWSAELPYRRISR